MDRDRPNSSLSDEILQTRKELNDLLSIYDLMKHPGWMVLQHHYSMTLSTIRDALMQAKDMNEVIRLQERYRAFTDMLGTAEALVLHCEQKQQWLENMESEKKERDQYGIDS